MLDVPDIPMVDRCPACGGDHRFARTFADLDRCQGCGFITYRQATPAVLSELYGERYFAGEEYPDYLGQQDALRRSMRRHLEQMSSYVPLHGSLLEIGCAYGLFLDDARRHFGRVVGVDVSPAPLAYARETFRLDVRSGDCLEMDFEGERFDVVCMWDTIEHLSAPHSFVAHARDLLRPGGWLFMTTGDIGALNARLRGARWRQIHPPSHLQYFSRNTMHRMLERIGFKVHGFGSASYYHTAYNILASIQLRRSRGAWAADGLLRLFGEDRLRRVGLWLDLGDTMFVAAKRAETLSAAGEVESRNDGRNDNLHSMAPEGGA